MAVGLGKQVGEFANNREISFNPTIFSFPWKPLPQVSGKDYDWLTWISCVIFLWWYQWLWKSAKSRLENSYWKFKFYINVQNCFPKIFPWYEACPVVFETDQCRTEKKKVNNGKIKPTVHWNSILRMSTNFKISISFKGHNHVFDRSKLFIFYRWRNPDIGFCKIGLLIKVIFPIRQQARICSKNLVCASFNFF